MKFLGKFLLSILLIVLLIIVLIYVLLQTSWGAGWISRTVTQHSAYQLSLEKIGHDWSDPGDVYVENITFGQKEHTPILVAKRLVAGFSARQLSDPYHFARIQMQNGTLNLDPTSLVFPLEADVLQLNDMAISSPYGGWELNGKQVDAGVMPWKPQVGFPLGRHSRFQISAHTLTLNGIPAENVLVQGEINNNQLRLDNLGADLARGELTGSAARDEDGSWQVDHLRLSNVRMQTKQNLDEFLHQLSAVPKITIHRFDLIDARMEGRLWAFSDLDLTLRNVTFQDGDWSSDDGTLALNARELINGSIHLIDPIATLAFTPHGIDINQFSGRWQGGLMRTSGHWSRTDKRLELDEFMVAGIEYVLPTQWLNDWQQPLPSWLSGVVVDKFTANRNLLIDINPAFPFQVTALDGTGKQLVLAKDHQWGIWSGSLNLNGSDATFNKTDVRRPSLALTADQGKISVTELSAFAGEGLLEATANINQQANRAFSLSLSGRAVPLNVLAHWGWPTIPLSGNGNLQLTLTGGISAASPLKPTLNGKLHVLDTEGKAVTQTMVRGALVGDTTP
ncbi:AsmA family protein [Acerihabitans sp. TG2]|uniref:AsmA family protein n=1 Tax=Acerihabitans sp. TG2 TaxID=3096008 RepID=UPI002B2310AB|nr:AsmA family protein [Acerihabitans sp. TG2]MEA9392385.1 AsmA family protein [Acerihabitans sp. TG2]